VIIQELDFMFFAFLKNRFKQQFCCMAAKIDVLKKKHKTRRLHITHAQSA
jgi:hypothetical protein